MPRCAMLLLLVVALAANAQAPARPPAASKASGESKPPVALKEFEGVARKAARREPSLEKELAALENSLKGRAMSDRATFISANEMPLAHGHPKTYQVLCGPTRDPDVRLAALLLTADRKVADLAPGAEITFRGTIAGVRYDSTAQMVVVIVNDATVE